MLPPPLFSMPADFASYDYFFSDFLAASWFSPADMSTLLPAARIYFAMPLMPLRCWLLHYADDASHWLLLFSFSLIANILIISVINIDTTTSHYYFFIAVTDWHIHRTLISYFQLSRHFHWLIGPILLAIDIVITISFSPLSTTHYWYADDYVSLFITQLILLAFLFFYFSPLIAFFDFDASLRLSPFRRGHWLYYISHWYIISFRIGYCLCHYAATLRYWYDTHIGWLLSPLMMPLSDILRFRHWLIFTYATHIFITITFTLVAIFITTDIFFFAINFLFRHYYFADIAATATMTIYISCFSIDTSYAMLASCIRFSYAFTDWHSFLFSWYSPYTYFADTASLRITPRWCLASHYTP